MNKNADEVWANCLTYIRSQINVQSFKTWFEPIRPLRLDGKSLLIQVPNRFFYEWLEEHYLSVLRQAIMEQLGEGAQLEYSISKRKTAAKKQEEQPEEQAAPISTGAIKLPKNLNKKGPTLSKDLEKNYGKVSPRSSDQIKNPFVIPGVQKIKIDPQLNSEYTFSSFIEGDCNRLARSAGWAVAKRPGQTSFNPLMIYGDVGLGKTHLAHAIGNEVLQNNMNKTVLYVSCEQFTNQFIDALRNNAISDFVNFYQLVDLLIVDDIQFLSEKIKTQDIFFHIFNHLHQGGKQLILTSDRPPKELKGIEERLTSRFKWGLSADLQHPSLETRMAIIQNKMLQDGIELPYNVTEFISANVRTNIRELEGILISMIAQAALNQCEIDLTLAKTVISKFVDNISSEINIDMIQRVVAEHYEIPVQTLKEKTRTKMVALARQIAMYLGKHLSNKSLKVIGQAFGGRDHTTVMHACRTIEGLVQKDRQFKETVEELTNKIRKV